MGLMIGLAREFYALAERIEGTHPATAMALAEKWARGDTESRHRLLDAVRAEWPDASPVYRYELVPVDEGQGS